MAKSKSGEFYSFDEVLRQLNIDENRLKRLVSEGEIRAFREGDQMKFKRAEIDNLAGRSGRGSTTSETSLTEISLEDESQPTAHAKARVDDEPDLTARGGMRTAEISSQDTFIDQGDVGMSTEPIDFTEEGGEAEAIEDIGADKGGKAKRKARGPAQTRAPVEEERFNPAWSFVLALTLIIAVCGSLVTLAVFRGPPSTGITKFFDDFFGPKPEQQQ